MGLGLLLVMAGAFVRFVLGRYQQVNGAYDAVGSVLLGLGVLSMLVATATWMIGRPRLVRIRDGADAPQRSAARRNGSDPPAPERF